MKHREEEGVRGRGCQGGRVKYRGRGGGQRARVLGREGEVQRTRRGSEGEGVREGEVKLREEIRGIGTGRVRIKQREGRSQGAAERRGGGGCVNRNPSPCRVKSRGTGCA